MRLPRPAATIDVSLASLRAFAASKKQPFQVRVASQRYSICAPRQQQERRHDIILPSCSARPHFEQTSLKHRCFYSSSNNSIDEEKNNLSGKPAKNSKDSSGSTEPPDSRALSATGQKVTGKTQNNSVFNFFSDSLVYNELSAQKNQNESIEKALAEQNLPLSTEKSVLPGAGVNKTQIETKNDGHAQYQGSVKSKLKHTRHEAVSQELDLRAELLVDGSTRVVLTAMASNFTIMMMKFAAAWVTKSSSMFAEGVHSMADFMNECLLFFGVLRSSRKPDGSHPYGYWRERYAWSLMSGIGIFFLGGGVSLYHGVIGLAEALKISSNINTPVDLHYAFLVLAGSLVFEGGTAILALKQVRRAALTSNQTVLEYIKNGADPGVVQILLEDVAAVCGVFVAGAALVLTKVTGNPVFDAAGSIGIGLLLATTATFLIRRNIRMIVETSMPKPREQLVVRTLSEDIVVRSVHDVKSVEMGMDGARFKAEVQFDGRVVAARYLKNNLDINRELDRVRSIATPDDLTEYLQEHGQHIIDQVAEEVDRIEIKIKKVVPEVKYCDLEIL